MQTPIQIRSAIDGEIRKAFSGVTLDRKISLTQAQLFDGAARKEYVPAQRETTDDWSRVPLEELEKDFIAHLDALGFRSYIPALMLSVLDHYDSSSMRVIGTLTGLYPKKDDGWEYHMHRYSLLSLAQRTAIARFLAALPELVELDVEDQKIVGRSLRNYWGQYLQMPTSE